MWYLCIFESSRRAGSTLCLLHINIDFTGREMLRVLVLHGYAQNEEVIRRKLTTIQEECAEDVKFTFANGPTLLSEANMDGFRSSKTIPTSPELAPRAWWIYHADRPLYEGGELGVNGVLQLMARSEPKFDGIMGFSQGAAMAAVICAILEKPHLHPYPPADLKQLSHPSLLFGILISGFKVLDAKLTTLFHEPLTTPTLHVLGLKDTTVSREWSQSLIDVCPNRRVEVHDGGHLIPSTSSWRAFFKNYINSYNVTSEVGSSGVASPSPAIISTPSALRIHLMHRSGSTKVQDGPGGARLQNNTRSSRNILL